MGSMFRRVSHTPGHERRAAQFRLPGGVSLRGNSSSRYAPTDAMFVAGGGKGTFSGFGAFLW